jgi:hypothetical protein
MTTPEPAARDPYPSWPRRAAALALLPLSLVPFLAGLGTVLRDPNRPGSGCFEYCKADSDGGRIALFLGTLGILLVVLIWRRHVAAMAVALFITSVITAILALSILVGILAGGFHWILLVYLAIGVVPLVLDGLLVTAMRTEMRRAGDAAARDVPVQDAAVPARPD